MDDLRAVSRRKAASSNSSGTRIVVFLNASIVTCKSMRSLVAANSRTAKGRNGSEPSLIATARPRRSSIRMSRMFSSLASDMASASPGSHFEVDPSRVDAFRIRSQGGVVATHDRTASGALGPLSSSITIDGTCTASNSCEHIYRADKHEIIQRRRIRNNNHLFNRD